MLFVSRELSMRELNVDVDVREMGCIEIRVRDQRGEREVGGLGGKRVPIH